MEIDPIVEARGWSVAHMTGAQDIPGEGESFYALRKPGEANTGIFFDTAYVEYGVLWLFRDGKAVASFESIEKLERDPVDGISTVDRFDIPSTVVNAILDV